MVGLVCVCLEGGCLVFGFGFVFLRYLGFTVILIKLKLIMCWVQFLHGCCNISLFRILPGLLKCQVTRVSVHP